MLNKTRLLLLAGTALLTAVTGFCIGVPPDDPPSPNGIWVHGDTVLLFAMFPACKEEGGPSHTALQTLVSKDGGRNWAWRGPRLTWSYFEFILDTGDEIWLAGNNYNPEGPASDPYVLLFDADSMEWPQFQIFNGDDELMAVARDDRDNNRFLAWVNHLINSEETDPTFLHQSLDHGRTWHIVKQVKSVPRSAAGLHFFQEIPQQSGAWRISNTDQPRTSFLEHQEPDGKWHPAARLPLPIQKCEEQVFGH